MDIDSVRTDVGIKFRTDMGFLASVTDNVPFFDVLMALAEAAHVNAFEDIGLALSVQSHKAIEFGCKLQTRLAYIAIIENI